MKLKAKYGSLKAFKKDLYKSGSLDGFYCKLMTIDGKKTVFVKNMKG